MSLAHQSVLHVTLCAAIFAVPALPAFAAQPLPGEISVDVSESFRLLRTSSYSPVDTQAILDGARRGLADEAKKHNLNVVIPDLRAGLNDDATADAINNVIASTADAAHAAPTDFAYAAISGMAKAVGDKYTAFFTPDQFKRFNQALDPDRISGIGVLVEPDAASGLIELSFVIPGTPADRAGLHQGDLIASIDGTSTKGLTLEEASRLLRGKPGTNVRVAVRQNADLRDVSLTRSEVQPPTVLFHMLNDGIGYIDVLAFGRATPSEFDFALSRVKDAGARAIVLDLRNDGGGYVDSALDIVSRFVSRKPILTVEQRGVADTTYRAENSVMASLPMTVLVNENTASASEITAGALQDDGIGAIVGTRTFGKGVMQTLTPLPDGAAIKITTAHYLTPLKRDINLKGIDPDVRIEENRDARFGVVEKDAQLRAAISFLQKKIADAKI